ncbi:uncharacterized protein LOC121416731 [Lytechinus variegatus]|uniref:uncharacterized protein LOC121416731 n=1 Tax=Lytechinus variegatus TaxID=7654 RepID=UPI001BB2112B|nr:uncharacterized protein LOC121416731 [Lytechinus variegatus]
MSSVHRTQIAGNVNPQSTLLTEASQGPHQALADPMFTTVVHVDKLKRTLPLSRLKKVDDEHYCCPQSEKMDVPPTRPIGAPIAPCVISTTVHVLDFVIRTLDSLCEQWAKRIQFDSCVLCPRCRKRKLRLQECFKQKSLQCGSHLVSTSVVKANFGITEESGSERVMMSRRSTCEETGVLCNRYFCDLAEKIGSEWRLLGIRLGLNQADIDHITTDNAPAVDRNFAMLRLWKQRSSCKGNRKEMVEDLCGALKSSSRTDLADEIREAAGLS